MTRWSGDDSAHAGRRLAVGAAVVAAACVSWTLLLSAGYGLGAFFARANAPDGQYDSEISGLGCIEQAVAAITTPGEAVRLVVPDDAYISQRVTELIYPRVRLVSDPSAPVLSLLPAPTPELSTCADLTITIDRDGDVD